jgi:hypothetical protein
MNLGTHMPDGERRKPIDIEVCRSKALTIHMFATRLSHLWCVTDFFIMVCQTTSCLHFYIECSSIRKKKRLRVFLCWFFPGCNSCSSFLCQVHVLVKYMYGYMLKHTWWQVNYMSRQVLVTMYCNILS